MKRLRFIICMLLICSLSFCFEGCSNKTKYITITVYDEGSSYAGSSYGWFDDIIRERFGIQLKFNKSSSQGFPAYLSQGYLGDIILFNNRADYLAAYNAGLLLDWNEHDFLKEYGSNLLTNHSAALERNRSLNSDGKIHGICGNISLDANSHSNFLDVFYIRWDLYKELGYPSIGTLEDLIPILSDMVQLEASKTQHTPYAVYAYSSFDSNMIDMASATAGMYGYEPFGFGLYNALTDSYEACLDPDGIYIRCLRFYNALYRMGLLNQDAYNATHTDAISEYNSGNAVMGLYEYTTSAYNTEEHLKNNQVMMPIVADDFSTVCTQGSTAGGDYFWAISNNAEFPDKCIEFIDWLFSEEGTLIANYGPKDLTWEYTSDGLPQLTKLGSDCRMNNDIKLNSSDIFTYAEGGTHLSLPTLDINSPIHSSSAVTYDCMTWPNIQATEWYISEFSLIDKASSDWKAHNSVSTLNEYIEHNGYTMIKASDFTIAPIDMELTIHVNELKSDMCRHSWDAIFAPTEADFELAINGLISACTARENYETIMNFYTNQLENYRSSIR